MDGIINVYKEKGYTSHDVVAKMRGILKMKKIGHTGTLDPEAEGVLPICLGSGTKLCGMLTDKTKTYRAGLLLGRCTLQVPGMCDGGGSESGGGELFGCLYAGSAYVLGIKDKWKKAL